MNHIFLYPLVVARCDPTDNWEINLFPGPTGGRRGETNISTLSLYIQDPYWTSIARDDNLQPGKHCSSLVWSERRMILKTIK